MARVKQKNQHKDARAVVRTSCMGQVAERRKGDRMFRLDARARIVINTGGVVCL